MATIATFWIALITMVVFLLNIFFKAIVAALYALINAIGKTMLVGVLTIIFLIIIAIVLGFWTSFLDNGVEAFYMIGTFFAMIISGLLMFAFLYFFLGLDVVAGLVTLGIWLIFCPLTILVEGMEYIAQFFSRCYEKLVHSMINKLNGS
ncbi:MAG: hypothetical protein R3Y67_07055 [Eubacteriales bacterium]